MKVNAIIFTNSIPEVRWEGNCVRIDLGVVEMELTVMEAVSMVMHLLVIEQVKNQVAVKFIEGR